ncbi:MAG TPA: BTAD domain-containing putative transcriptional regulator, partial [Longimicrobium sp.]|nr:BTAD domain-containing putative transcriptional regulator [Longimicrobium sp.]
MAVFYLHVLGDPVLLGPAGPVTGRAAYRRRLALLSILAVARERPVGRERIIGLLWPEKPADAARHTLSEALYVLRKELGEDLFQAVGDEIALNPAVMGSDAADFEEAVQAGRPEDAVRAYRGPLLDGFNVSDAPEFERWVDGERDRLSRAFAQVLEGLALAADAGGDAAAAVEWWRRLAAHDRYSSRVALRLVRALDAAGDRMAALRFASTHAVLLREELGSEPDRELAALVERLREEPAPALAHAAAQAPAAADAPAAEPAPAAGEGAAPAGEAAQSAPAAFPAALPAVAVEPPASAPVPAAAPPAPPPPSARRPYRRAAFA